MTIACPDCGTLEDLPPLPAGAAAVCPTCANTLERTGGRSLDAALACGLAAFVLLLPANLLPLIRISMPHRSQDSYIASGVTALWNDQWVLIAALVAAFAIMLPLLHFGLLSTALALLRFGRRPAWLGRAFRWTVHLDLWAMPDVFLVAFAVGYNRLAAILPVQIGWGGYCMIAAALLALVSRATLDHATVWRMIAPEGRLPPEGGSLISCTVCDLALAADAEGSRCPRCGARLKARKTASMASTTALVIAGFVLFLPANLYPVSTVTRPDEHVAYRVIDGVIELFQAGMWPLGILILCTSIAVPLLKLVGLGWFVLSIRRKSAKRLVLRARLHRLIDGKGRWSNVEVFALAVFVPLLDSAPLFNARMAPAAPAFLLVVVLTMIASRAFDPRLMWDAASAGRP